MKSAARPAARRSESIPGPESNAHLDPATADLLHGHKEIAKFLGLTPRQVSWHDERGNLPTFKLGRAVCARKSKLIEWVEGLELLRRETRGPRS